MTRVAGFTLIELVVTLTVAAILVAIGLPAFSSFIVSQRIKTASFDVVSSLTFARSEALKSNAAVTVAPVGGNWAAGWQVTRTADSSVVKAQGATDKVSITGPGSLTFGRSGRITAGAGNFELDASTSGNRVTQRCITLDPTGVPRSKMGLCS